MKKKYPDIDFIKCNDPKSAVENVDILLTVSTSRSPIVHANWVSKGTHITAIGACASYMQEIEPEVLQKADKIFADSIEKCIKDGEIDHALEK